MRARSDLLHRILYTTRVIYNPGHRHIVPNLYRYLFAASLT